MIGTSRPGFGGLPADREQPNRALERPLATEGGYEIVLPYLQIDFLGRLFPLFWLAINSRPIGLFTGNYREYRGSGQAIDSHTERS